MRTAIETELKKALVIKPDSTKFDAAKENEYTKLLKTHIAAFIEKREKEVLAEQETAKKKAEAEAAKKPPQDGGSIPPAPKAVTVPQKFSGRKVKLSNFVRILQTSLDNAMRETDFLKNPDNDPITLGRLRGILLSYDMGKINPPTAEEVKVLAKAFRLPKAVEQKLSEWPEFFHEFEEKQAVAKAEEVARIKAAKKGFEIIEEAVQSGEAPKPLRGAKKASREYAPKTPYQTESPSSSISRSYGGALIEAQAKGQILQSNHANKYVSPNLSYMQNPKKKDAADKAKATNSLELFVEQIAPSALLPEDFVLGFDPDINRKNIIHSLVTRYGKEHVNTGDVDPATRMSLYVVAIENAMNVSGAPVQEALANNRYLNEGKLTMHEDVMKSFAKTLGIRSEKAIESFVTSFGIKKVNKDTSLSM